MDLRIQVENLNDIFVDLLNEQVHLPKREKIKETKISELENMMKSLNPFEFEKKIRELNEELNNKFCYLNTETEVK